MQQKVKACPNTLTSERSSVHSASHNDGILSTRLFRSVAKSWRLLRRFTSKKKGEKTVLIKLTKFVF